MKYLLILALLLPLPGYSQETVAELKAYVRRLEQVISRVREDNIEYRSIIRNLEREMSDLKDQTESYTRKTDELSDELLKTKNQDIANLESGQQNIFNMMDELNWGTLKRDCPGLGLHQQIKNTQSEDGNYTLRYLCLDGRALHLGTEVHQPPQ